jgi:prophage DNA circulation protein
MSSLDDVKNLLGLGPNDWKARLQPSITFISPEGSEFTALWRGSPRSVNKKLGIFSPVKVRGQIAKDLDSDSDVYNLTFYFEGPNNDTEAQRFFMATRQTGPWEVTHPVHGFLELTLVSITESDEPVESGNITELTSEWIEAIDEAELLTARELAGITDALGDDLDTSAALETVKNVVQTSLSVTAAVSAAVQAVINVVDQFIKPLFEGDETLVLDNAEIKADIDNTLSETPINIDELAGQIQSMIQNPILASDKVIERLTAYDKLKDGLLAQLPSVTPGLVTPKADAEAKNTTAIIEAALSSTIVANAKIATTGTLDTRAQAIDIAGKLGDALASITDGLDTVQAAYEDKDLENQYFSQSESFADAASITSTAIQYLLISAYDLKIEKRFILEKYRRPIEITITEYGDLGDNDENFELFVSSNQLAGKEIFFLPPGREVVVYV